MIYETSCLGVLGPFTHNLPLEVYIIYLFFIIIYFLQSLQVKFKSSL